MAKLSNYEVTESWVMYSPRRMNRDWSSYTEDGVARMSSIGPALFSYRLCIASCPDWKSASPHGPVLVVSDSPSVTTSRHISHVVDALRRLLRDVTIFHVHSADHPNVREFQARTKEDPSMRAQYPLPPEGMAQYLRNFHNRNLMLYEERIEEAIDRTKRARKPGNRQYWLEHSAKLGVERDTYRLWAEADMRRGG